MGKHTGSGCPCEGECTALRISRLNGEAHGAAHIDHAGRLHAIGNRRGLDGYRRSDGQGRLTGGRTAFAIADRHGEVAAGVRRACGKRDSRGGCRSGEDRAGAGAGPRVRQHIAVRIVGRDREGGRQAANDVAWSRDEIRDDRPSVEADVDIGLASAVGGRNVHDDGCRGRSTVVVGHLEGERLVALGGRCGPAGRGRRGGREAIRGRAGRPSEGDGIARIRIMRGGLGRDTRARNHVGRRQRQRIDDRHRILVGRRRSGLLSHNDDCRHLVLENRDIRGRSAVVDGRIRQVRGADRERVVATHGKRADKRAPSSRASARRERESLGCRQGRSTDRRDDAARADRGKVMHAKVSTTGGGGGAVVVTAACENGRRGDGSERKQGRERCATKQLGHGKPPWWSGGSHHTIRFPYEWARSRYSIYTL